MKLENGRKWVFVLALFAISAAGKAQVVSANSPSSKAEIDGSAVQTRIAEILPLPADASSGPRVQGKIKTPLDETKSAVDFPESGKALLRGAAAIDGSVVPVSDGRVPGPSLVAITSLGKSKGAIPDSPGAFRIVAPKRETEQAAPSGKSAEKPDKSVSRVAFWSLQGLMFGSAIAAAETTHNCIQSGSCTEIPVQFRTRAAMYSAGLPVAAGIAILSYEMKKHGNRWWFVPPAMVIAADGLVTSHSVKYSN